MLALNNNLPAPTDIARSTVRPTTSVFMLLLWRRKTLMTNMEMIYELFFISQCLLTPVAIPQTTISTERWHTESQTDYCYRTHTCSSSDFSPATLDSVRMLPRSHALPSLFARGMRCSQNLVTRRLDVT